MPFAASEPNRNLTVVSDSHLQRELAVWTYMLLGDTHLL